MNQPFRTIRRRPQIRTVQPRPNRPSRRSCRLAATACCDSPEATFAATPPEAPDAAPVPPAAVPDRPPDDAPAGVPLPVDPDDDDPDPDPDASPAEPEPDDPADVESDEPADVIPSVCAAVSVASCCCDLVRSTCALSSAACRSVGSIVARVSPGLTASPTFTLTAATVPDTGNDASARSFAAIVPTDVTSSLTDPVAATAVRTVGASDEVRATARPAPSAVRVTTPATATIIRRLRNRTRRACAAMPERVAGGGVSGVGMGSVGVSDISGSGRAGRGGPALSVPAAPATESGGAGGGPGRR